MSALEPRICERDGCDDVLVRRDGEPAGRWEARRVCSRACSAKIAGAARTASLEASLQGRSCASPGCGKALERRDEETLAHYGRRTCCDTSCASRVHNRPVEDAEARHCTNPDCGRVLVRRDGEARSSFVRRSTCDRRCGAAVAHATMGHGAAAGARSQVVGSKASPIRRKVDLDAFGEPRTDEVWRPASFAGRPDARPQLVEDQAAERAA